MQAQKQRDRRDIEILESIFKITQEYCRLSLISDISEEQAELLQAILDLAKYDSSLSFWIDQADEFICPELQVNHDEYRKNSESKIRILNQISNQRYIKQ